MLDIQVHCSELVKVIDEANVLLKNGNSNSLHNPNPCPCLSEHSNHSNRDTYYHPAHAPFFHCSSLTVEYLGTAPPQSATHYSIAWSGPLHHQARPAIPAPSVSRPSCSPVAAPVNFQGYGKQKEVSTSISNTGFRALMLLGSPIMRLQ